MLTTGIVNALFVFRFSNVFYAGVIKLAAHVQISRINNNVFKRASWWWTCWKSTSFLCKIHAFQLSRNVDFVLPKCIGKLWSPLTPVLGELIHSYPSTPCLAKFVEEELIAEDGCMLLMSFHSLFYHHYSFNHIIFHHNFYLCLKYTLCIFTYNSQCIGPT